MLPKVVIVGRPNVGKSSLLNLLAGKMVSIVDPTAGVTRDRVSAHVELVPEFRDKHAKFVELVDTGGYGIEDVQDLTADVERQIAYGMAEADLILFVVDAQQGILPLDREVAKLLREQRGRGRENQAKIVLVANKVDGPSHEPFAYEAMQLGFGEPVLVSAASGHHKGMLIDAVLENIDWEKVGEARPPDAGLMLAIVGKRNAGKSTLVNALAGAPRVIVSEKEGTTRDSVDVRFEIDDKVYTAIDTAGVRKTKSLAGDIEYYSHHRALRSVRRADVVLFLFDASVPVSQVDHQLGNEIQKHFKPTVIVVNKWDLAQGKATQDEYAEYLDKEMKGLDFAPIVFTVAKDADGLKEVLALARNLHEQASHRVTTSELNQVMEQLLKEKTPTSGIGRRPKIYYATQLGVNPPTIGLFVNDPSMFDNSYQRFLINRFRELLPFAEVPIKLIIRGREKKPKGEE
jgi:GTPase